MNGPDDIRRALGRLALALAVLGFASVAAGIGLILLGVAGGTAMAFGGALGSGVGLSAIALIAGVALAAGGLPELFAWYGISRRTAWGRWLGIVLCTVMLAAFPFGTAFGAWGLWVLLSSNGLRAFGMQRSWLGDGAALLVGWFFMPEDEERGWRVDRRGRRHRRGRHGGRGGLLLLLLIFGVIAFATCGSCVKSFASGVASGVSSTAGSAPGVGAPGVGAPLPQGDDALSGMSFGPPAAAGAQAGAWLRTLGVLDAAAAADGPAAGGAAPVAPQPPSQGSVVPPPMAELPPPPAPADNEPARDSPGGRGQLWTFEDREGVTHIVDDERKIPANRRHTARRQ